MLIYISLLTLKVNKHINFQNKRMRSQRDKISYRTQKSLKEIKRLLENVFIVKKNHFQGVLLFYKSRYFWSREKIVVFRYLFHFMHLGVLCFDFCKRFGQSCKKIKIQSTIFVVFKTKKSFSSNQWIWVLFSEYIQSEHCCIWF